MLLDMSLCFVRLVPPRYIVSPSSEIYIYIYIGLFIARYGSARGARTRISEALTQSDPSERKTERERERETERERFLTLVGWNSWVLRRSSRANLSRETGRNADPA